MFQICPGCMNSIPCYEPDLAGSLLICPECGTAQRFVFRPLRIVMGASGAGKSTVVRALVGRTPGLVVLEGDMLWAPEFDHPEDGYRRYRETSLRLAANIHQSGVDTLLIGSGQPDQFENCFGRALFSEARYAALVCSDALLRERLEARPAWRGSSDPETLDRMSVYNGWLWSRSSSDETPAVAPFDTTEVSVEATVDAVRAWLDEPVSRVMVGG